MDFPIKVPGAGLVGGRFVDENAVTGQQGSLLAAQWGNQLTDEILNVIKLAHTDDPDNPNFIPSETQSNQMALAIQKLIEDALIGVGNSWSNLENKPLALTSLLNINTIKSTTTLTNAQLGIVLIDASANDVAITLPPANTDNKAVKVTLYRLDHSVNKVTIKAATGETILFNTRWKSSGYGFFYLMGASDYWQIVSNGNGSWFKFSSYNSSTLGELFFNTSKNIPAGGFILGSGTLLVRTEYPWLWDYAEQSGMLVDDSTREGFDGCWTKGDDITTFRMPDLRGAFLRVLDNNKGIDIDRAAGSFQSDAIRNIKGTFDGNVDDGETGKTGPFYNTNSPWGGANGSTSGGGLIGFDVSRAVPTALENRPKNIAYPALIKII